MTRATQLLAVNAADAEIVRWEAEIRAAAPDDRWSLCTPRRMLRRCACGYIARAKVQPFVTLERTPRGAHPTIDAGGRVVHATSPAAVASIDWSTWRCAACTLERAAHKHEVAARKFRERAAKTRAKQERSISG